MKNTVNLIIKYRDNNENKEGISILMIDIDSILDQKKKELIHEITSLFQIKLIVQLIHSKVKYLNF